MYYIVEITSRGSETFLEGFEDIGDAWDVVSRLICSGGGSLPGLIRKSMAFWSHAFFLAYDSPGFIR